MNALRWRFEGAFWPLRTHQFRRSLAVHLRRLDLISTNDLIRQFKHLIRGMTEWYMSGALNASHFSRAIPQAFAAEIERVDTELSASGLFLISMKACFMAKAGSY